MGVLTLLAHLFLQIAVLFNPVLPFSMPSRKAQRSASYIIAMIIVPIAAIGLLIILTHLMYPKPPLLAGAVICLAAVSYLLEFILKKRVQRRTASMEYQG
jgi:hypothetical protein